MMKRSGFLLYISSLVIIIIITWSGATFGRRVKSDDDVLEYMMRFGYIDEPEMKKLKAMPKGNRTTMMEKSLKMFDLFCGGSGKSVMNAKLMKMMQEPRCGNKEDMKVMRNQDLKAGTPGHSSWDVLDIHYHIKNFPSSGISPEIIRKEIRKAFDLWESVSNIKCTEKPISEKVEIEISFVRGPHNDNITFDKRMIGDVVAHAFYPHPPDYLHLRGDIHFDDSRGWTVDTADGLNFFQIATHEIGHALGLEHSTVAHSVMVMIPPREFDPNFTLHEDDIKGIQNLYGAIAKDNLVSNENKISSRILGGSETLDTSGSSHVPSYSIPIIPTKTVSPQVPTVYHDQPLRYLWNCHLLATYFRRPADSLQCYENVTRYLLYIHQSRLNALHTT